LLPALSQWLLHTPVSSLARLALVIVAGQLYDESGKPYLPGLLPDRSEVVRLLSGSLVGSESEATVLLSELGAAGVLTWVKRKAVAIYCDYCERNITAARYFGAGGEYLLARCRAAEMSAACQRSRLHRRVEQRLEREQVRLRAGTAAGQAEWAGLKAQYGNRCLCCGGREADGVALTADHIVPLSRGGEDERSNLQPLCRPCNSAKGRQRWDYRPAAEEPG